MTDSFPPAKKVRHSTASAAAAEHRPPAVNTHRRNIWLAAGIIIVVGIAAYSNSFQGKFLRHDDSLSITNNPHIQKLWPLSEAISLLLWSTGSTVAGRPILSISFAVSYALSGLEPWGYHLGNIIIHIIAALLLFAIVKRTLDYPQFNQRFGTRAVPLALAVALLWMVHPFQTESVTQMAQRAESMMGMFFLLTLYCAIRGFNSSRSRLWYLAAVLACALGMGTKEVMVAAPLIVPLYDYIFVSKSLKQLLTRRWGLYLSLAATWIIVVALVLIIHYKSGGLRLNKNWTVLKNADWLGFTLAQPSVVLEYLRLSFWPWPLGFQGLLARPLLSANTLSVTLSVIIVLALLALTFWGILRHSWLGFISAWFFLILAPSSSFVPTLDFWGTIHRMYLSLAALVICATFVIDYLLRKFVSPRLGKIPVKILAVSMIALIVAAYTFLTFQQNKNYKSEVAMWTNILRHNPDSIDAHMILNEIYTEKGETDRAEFHDNELLRAYKKQFEREVQLYPNRKEVHYNLGTIYAQQGDYERAKAEFEHEIRINPDHVEAHFNLGNVFLARSEPDKAVEEYNRAIQIPPEKFDYLVDHYKTQIGARINIGSIFIRQGKHKLALEKFETVLQMDPDNVLAMNNLAWLLVTSPKDNLRNGYRAIELARRLCDITTFNSPTYTNTLAAAYAEAGRFDDAVAIAENALALAKSQNAPASQLRHIQMCIELYKEKKPFRQRP